LVECAPIGDSVVLNQRRSPYFAATSLAISLNALLVGSAAADEAGVGFWLPGQFGSFAAAPYSQPGWSFESVYFHAKATGSGSVGFPRGGSLQVGVNSPSDLFFFTPTYVLETPIWGAQAALGLSVTLGRNSTSASATLTGPGGITISGARSDDVVGFGDLVPTASLSWNKDVHNVMVYMTGNIPVGAYDTTRLSALGLGYWAIDGGVGYTYLNEEAGIEWSAVLGLTYNFTNPHTNYRSGIDLHLDWAISPYVSDTMHFGAVGYFYEQLTADKGAGAILGGFKSRVAGIGPQIGFFFPVADRQAYLSFKGYYEFGASNRLHGWNAWVTLSLEPPERKSSNAKNGL
jgi:hypothetical protein